uniref:Beta-(1-->2)glucan export ATP-binding/permease protein NdvA n=1 Tax=Anthurium amnicola TaxID=1678845 RepID=A0A1D1ZC21_9ARAE
MWRGVVLNPRWFRVAQARDRCSAFVLVFLGEALFGGLLRSGESEFFFSSFLFMPKGKEVAGDCSSSSESIPEESSSSSERRLLWPGEGTSQGVVIMPRRAAKGTSGKWLREVTIERQGQTRKAPDSPNSCVSTVTPEECRLWQKEYDVPEGVDLLAPNPDFRALTPIEFQFSMYEGFFEAGFRFPIPSFVVALLCFYNQAPAQLTPNSWRLIFCYLVLCIIYSRKPNLLVFRKLFSMRTTGSHYSCLSARRGTHFLSLSPKFSSNKGYKSRFFFASSVESSTSGTIGWNFPIKWQDFDKCADQEPDLSPEDSKDCEFFLRLGQIQSAEGLVLSWHAWSGGPYDGAIASG